MVTVIAMEWWKDHAELVHTASWLVDRCELSTPDDVVAFFEKPWKWTEEHELMVDEERAAA